MTIDEAMKLAENTLSAYNWTFLPSILKYAPSQRGQFQVSMLILNIRYQFDLDYAKNMNSPSMKNASYEAYNNEEKAFKVYLICELNKGLMKLDSYYRNSLILPLFGLKNRVEELSFSFLPQDYYSGHPVESCSRSDNRDLLLYRDDYMCRATGRYDLELGVMAFDGVAGDSRYWLVIDAHAHDHLVSADYLQAAHVIPYSLNNFDKTKPEEYQVIWKTLQEFSGFNLSTLKGKLINDDSNMLMLCPTAHKMHDDLRLSFSPVPSQFNRFKVNIFGELAGWFGLVKDETTTLEVKDNKSTVDKGINSNYLAIHHAICVILEKSGIYGELKKERKIEYIEMEKEYIYGN
ncbi:hypothetical protein BDQ12DRAFT_747148 [Crucibulum laeve]|uniref:HNH nuclease domain-containing protein n=1 Tax=Crucibulum laeve TaxID=68775 RepID=A0A5C3LFL2_9AGAR|nr:hypothetical protein BDQ12DRAFT_747148 [Crucibulum laeve]